MSGCQKNSSKEVNCLDYNKKYIEYVHKERDSALYYLDKAIECEPQGLFFPFEKAKFYSREGSYEDAAKAIEPFLTEEYPEIIGYYGVLFLKLEQPKKAEKFLIRSYELIKEKSFDPDDYFGYSQSLIKIGLENYFKGSDIAIESLENFEDQGKWEGQKRFAEVLNEVIKSKSKEEVLYFIYNLD